MTCKKIFRHDLGRFPGSGHVWLKRSTTTAAAVILAAAALAATGPGAGAADSLGTKAKPITLTLWWWNPGGPKLIKAFEKQYPTLRLKIPAMSSATLPTKLTTTLAAGTGAPDVAQIEYNELPGYLATHKLLNIAPYVSSVRSQFPAWVWGQVSQGSKVYALPGDIDPMGLIYRPQVLKKYDLPVPTTWAQFESDALAVHKDDKNLYMAPSPEYDGTTLAWQAGCNMFAKSPSGKWTVDINSGCMQKVVGLWATMLRAGAVPVTPIEGAPEFTHQVAEGDYVSFLGAPWFPTFDLLPYIKPGSQSFAIENTPEWVAGKPMDADNGGSAYAVTDQSKHPQAAALLVKWLFTNKVAMNIEEKPGSSGGSGLFLANNSRALVPSFSQKVPDFTQNVDETFASYSKTINQNFVWSPWTVYLTDELVKIWPAVAHGESPSSALAAVQTAVIQYAQSEGYSVTAGAVGQ